MASTLVVGDPHLKISSIKEAKLFIHNLLMLVSSGKYKKLIILGDLFDTFAVIRSEIMALWSHFFANASLTLEKIIILVGNHDMAGESGGDHALEPFKSFVGITVVEKPMMIDGNHYIPFIRDNKEFEKLCSDLPAGKILFCHQSFNGAQFENGFYDPNGADPACVAQLCGVISGHIHKNQKIANIWYPGTPFQMSFSDVFETKGVFEIDLDESKYNQVDTLDLGMPRYYVLDEENTEKLVILVKSLLQSDIDLAQSNLKLVTTAGPAEIAAFWKEESVKLLKSKAKRVVDGLSPIRTEVTIPGAAAKSKRERLHDFIKSRKWRTPTDNLISAAESILTE